MKFKVDENLPVELAAELRLRGHDADTVFDEALGGAPDPAVVSAAFDAGRIVMTLDKGIANPQQYPVPSAGGVVLFRPDSLGRRAVLEFIVERLDGLLALPLYGRLTVVGSTRLRIR